MSGRFATHRKSSWIDGLLWKSMNLQSSLVKTKERMSHNYIHHKGHWVTSKIGGNSSSKHKQSRGEMTLTKYPASRTRMQNKAQMAGYTHLRMHCRYWPTKKDREWNKCELKFVWRFNPMQGNPDRKIGKLIITASEQIEMIPWKLFWFFHQRRGDFFSHNIFDFGRLLCVSFSWFVFPCRCVFEAKVRGKLIEAHLPTPQSSSCNQIPRIYMKFS